MKKKVRIGLIIAAAAALNIGGVMAFRSISSAFTTYAEHPAGITIYGAQVPGLIESHLAAIDPGALDTPSRRDLIDQLVYMFRSPTNVDEQEGDLEVVYWPVPGERGARKRGIAVVREMEERGAFDLLDELSAVRRAIREPQDGSLLWWNIGELGPLRRATRACAGRMHLAGEVGDHPEAARAFEHMMAIGRLVTHDSIMISHLVGAAVVSLALDQVYQWVMLHRPDAEALRGFIAAMDRQQKRIPIALAVEGERLAGLDTARMIYEDPHLTPEQAIVVLMRGGDEPAPSRWRARQMVRSRMGGMPMREEVDSSIADLIARALHIVGLAHQQRVHEIAALEAFIDDLPPTHRITRFIASGLPRALEADTTLEAKITGMRAFLALELFHAERGHYPDSLEGLVPEYLQAVPEDPYTGEMFRYRLLPEGEDESGRGYLLYSVGRDREDNGGRMHEDGPHVAGHERGEGFDLVINRPAGQ